MILWLSICLFSSISIMNGLLLHDHMTAEEIRLVFNCKHDMMQKLKYEVTPIFHGRNLQQKPSPTIHLKAFHKNYTLYLEENERILLGVKTSVFIAKPNLNRKSSNDSDILYSRIPYPLPPTLKSYHDMENRAAITVFVDKNQRTHANGIIGNDIIIRSLPNRLHEEVLNNKFNPSSDEFSSRNSYQATHHVIMKSNLEIPNSHEAHWDQLNDLMNSDKSETPNEGWPNQSTNLLSKERSAKLLTQKPATQKSSASKNIPEIHSGTVYPEILVVVDHETFNTHGSSVEEVSKYMVAFWNAVDLRFRELRDPKVRLSIAGLVISKVKNGTSYLDQHVVGNNVRLSSKTVRETGSYFANERQFPSDMYDAVVVIANRNFGKYDKKRKLISTVTGIAFVRGACRSKEGYASALARDKGGFNGITTATHELAHALGAPHDGDASAKVTGGPCSWADGFLMSYHRVNSNGMHWSICSKNAMQEYMKSDKAACLRNKPDSGTPYPKVLPGRVMTRDEQCRRSLGPATFSFKNGEGSCSVLMCALYVVKDSVKKIEPVTELRPPAEGTPCGSGGICLDGECVKIPAALTL